MSYYPDGVGLGMEYMPEAALRIGYKPKVRKNWYDLINGSAPYSWWLEGDIN
jgi:hypothetical protein